MAQVLYSSFGDGMLAASLANAYLLLGADRTILPEKHPAIFYAAEQSKSGSTVVKVPHIGLLGYDPFGSAGTEGAAYTPTALTDSSTSITIAYYRKGYDVSDLNRSLDALGQISPQAFLLDAIQTSWNHLVTMIAALMDDFSNTVGSSGVNMTASDFIDANTGLNVSNAPGDRLAILHPVQLGDLHTDLATVTGGSLVFSPAVRDSVESMGKGNGYQGKFLGSDIFTTTQIPTANAGADRAGGLFARGAICWADMVPVIDDPTRQMLVGAKAKFSMEPSGLTGTSLFTTALYMGVSEGIDTFGRSIVTDA